ncbi:hypothetical protein Tco_1563549 [Tanacetum coccineum]
MSMLEDRSSYIKVSESAQDTDEKKLQGWSTSIKTRRQRRHLQHWKRLECHYIMLYLYLLGTLYLSHLSMEIHSYLLTSHSEIMILNRVAVNSNSITKTKVHKAKHSGVILFSFFSDEREILRVQHQQPLRVVCFVTSPVMRNKLVQQPKPIKKVFELSIHRSKRRSVASLVPVEVDSLTHVYAKLSNVIILH